MSQLIPTINERDILSIDGQTTTIFTTLNDPNYHWVPKHNLNELASIALENKATDDDFNYLYDLSMFLSSRIDSIEKPDLSIYEEITNHDKDIQDLKDLIKANTYQLVTTFDNGGGTSWTYADYDRAKWTMFEIALEQNNVAILEIPPNDGGNRIYTTVPIDFSANASNNVRFNVNNNQLAIWDWGSNTGNPPNKKFYTVRVFTHS